MNWDELLEKADEFIASKSEAYEKFVQEITNYNKDSVNQAIEELKKHAPEKLKD